MINTRNDYFENLINAMFINEDTAFYNSLKRLSTIRKCAKILHFIDGDTNLFVKNISKYNELSKTKYIDYVINVFKTYVSVGQVKKREFGEVMTPIFLVENMLNVLPKEMWSNPNLKWLDNCAGVGIFPAVIIQKLMIGLIKFEPNEEKRYKHIVENMIYIGELQSKNVFLLLLTLDPLNKYNINIYCGDFLCDKFNKHMKNEWKVNKFDITIGNPPYNQTVDLKFLNKSYDLSDKVLFVHPATWLIDEKFIQNKFEQTKKIINKKLQKVILFNGNKIFGIQLFVPCSITYVNKQHFGDVEVIDKINGIKIKYKNIDDINKYSTQEYIHLRDKIKTYSEKDNVWKHYNNTGEFFVNFSAIRGHVSINNDEFLAKSDLYTTVTKDEAVSDKIEKYLYFGFDNKTAAENFLNYNKTKFFRFCLSIYKNNANLHRGELAIIPWLDFSEKWDDEKLFKFFNLTHNEICFINKVIPDYY